MPNNRTQITNRIAAYNKRAKEIRANPDLSDAGKRKALAKLYAAEKNTVAKLRDTDNNTVATRRAQLEKQLFSIGSEPNYGQAVIAYRDAKDRVRQIKTGHDAQLAMREAIRDGDAYMAKALFSRAWDQSRDRLTGSGWGAIVNAYVNEYAPRLASAAEELARIQNADTRAARMTQAIETSVTRPPELQGMTEYDLQRLLADDPDQDEREQDTADRRAALAGHAAAAFDQGIADQRDGVYGSTTAAYIPDDAA